MEEKVLEFISEKLSLTREEINNNTIITAMGVPSIYLLATIVDMEERFGIQFSDREVASFVTVGDIICAVEKKVICQGKAKQ